MLSSRTCCRWGRARPGQVDPRVNAHLPLTASRVLTCTLATVEGEEHHLPENPNYIASPQLGLPDMATFTFTEDLSMDFDSEDMRVAVPVEGGEWTPKFLPIEARRALCNGIALNTTAAALPPSVPGGPSVWTGSRTEGALLEVVYQAGFDAFTTRAACDTRTLLPFSSKRKCMASLAYDPDRRCPCPPMSLLAVPHFVPRCSFPSPSSPPTPRSPERSLLPRCYSQQLPPPPKQKERLAQQEVAFPCCHLFLQSLAAQNGLPSPGASPFPPRQEVTLVLPKSPLTFPRFLDEPTCAFLFQRVATHSSFCLCAQSFPLDALFLPSPLALARRRPPLASPSARIPWFDCRTAIPFHSPLFQRFTTRCPPPICLGLQ